MKRFRFLVSILLGVAILSGGCGKEERVVRIGTGGKAGIYYVLGGAFSRCVNRRSHDLKIRVEPVETDGSGANIDSVLAQARGVWFGLVQSDLQYRAYKGEGEWSDSGPQTDLRSVFSIHQEAITLIASGTSGVWNIRDLKGKRVNLGSRGSGSYHNAMHVLKAIDLKVEALSPRYAGAVDAPRLLHGDRIDAFFNTIGHPNINTEEATTGRDSVRIVAIDDLTRARMMREHPYHYEEVVIPCSYYRGVLNTEDVKTLGVRATLVTSASVDEEIVYRITRMIFEDLDSLKTTQPLEEILRPLKKEDMFEQLTAPIHRGALRYYREVGLDEYIDPKLIE